MRGRSLSAGIYHAEPLDTMEAEVAQFHGMLADAMTHAGQLALLRRLAGTPVWPENFVVADIRCDRLGPDQAEPVSRIRNGRNGPPKPNPSSSRLPRFRQF